MDGGFKENMIDGTRTLMDTSNSWIMTQESPVEKLGMHGAGGASLTVLKQTERLNQRGIPTTLVGPAPREVSPGLMIPTKLYELKDMVDMVKEGAEDPDKLSSDTLLEIYSDPRVAERIRGSIPKGVGVIGEHFYTTHGILKHGVPEGKRVLYFHHSPFTKVRQEYDPRFLKGEDTTKKSNIRTTAEKEILRKADGVVFFTQAEADLTAQKYPDINFDSRLHVTPLGIDIQRFNTKRKAALQPEMRDRFGIPEDAIVFYMQARVGASMGQLLLAEMFYENFMPENAIYLALIGGVARGESDYMNQIRELQARSNGKILLTGPLPPEQGHALGDVSVGLKLETWGYSNLEAMAMGNPVLVQDNPIHREIYGNDDGVLYVKLGDIKDQDTIAELTYRLHRGWKDHAFFHNPRVAQVLSWDRAIDGLQECMVEVLVA